ncbi:MAG: OmpA family protein [Myxococcales bacterium]|jgi:chemotaxis protein MotB|nr:OmpA family protein [Myxococcales bacterium]MBL9111083.1 OmpA family protein [Myxococcales bacterium]
MPLRRHGSRGPAQAGALVALALASVLATGCGIPKSEYDAAVADRDKEKAHAKALETEGQAQQKARAELEARLKEVEAKANDADTRAQLDELKKQKAAAEARAKLFDDLVSKLKKMTDTGKVAIAARHGQIVLLLETDVLFDVGKTEIKPDGVQALTDVAQALRTVQGRRFVVIGHTDTYPIQTKEFPSNWELSTARGVAVTKLLVAKGVSAADVTAAGHAEFDPVAPNGSPEGRQANRRIEIALQPNVEELIALPEVKPISHPRPPPPPDKPTAPPPGAKPGTPPPPPPPGHPPHGHKGGEKKPAKGEKKPGKHGKPG